MFTKSQLKYLFEKAMGTPVASYRSMLVRFVRQHFVLLAIFCFVIGLALHLVMPALLGAVIGFFGPILMVRTWKTMRPFFILPAMVSFLAGMILTQSLLMAFVCTTASYVGWQLYQTRERHQQK